MKFPKAILLIGVLPGFASAGDLPSSKAAAIESPPPESRWRFGVSFAPLLNVKAGFSGLGAFRNPLPILPVGGGQNYEYDDGYVRVDDSGNNGGVTNYWGYDNASQYDAGSNTLSFNLTNSLQSGRAGETEEASPGFEVFGYLDMGDIADLAGRQVRWGFKGGLHYANVSVGGKGSLTSDIIRVTDSFDTTGITLFPSPGYQGTPGGNGPIIGDSPDRTVTVIADGATVTGGRELDVDMVSFSAGPYLEIPVVESFSIFAEAGVSVSVARGNYEFDSTTTITGVGTQTSSGDETRTVILPGVYAGFSAIWQLTDRFGLHGSARYQYIDSFSVNANGSEASLDFDGSAIVSLGCVWTY
jgi:hypothetical protein